MTKEGKEVFNKRLNEARIRIYNIQDEVDNFEKVCFNRIKDIPLDKKLSEEDYKLLSAYVTFNELSTKAIEIMKILDS